MASHKELRSPQFEGAHGPGNTYFVGNSQPHLAQDSVHYNCEQKPDEGSRLRQRRCDELLFLAFSRRRVSQALKFLQGNPSDPYSPSPSVASGCAVLKTLCLIQITL